MEITWHRAHGHDDFEIPLSVVAALAMLSPPRHERDHAAQQVAALDNEQFGALMRTQWGSYIRARPDLLNRAWPLMKPWLGEHPITGSVLDAARRVATTATSKAQFHLTGYVDSRRDVDLLGIVLTEIRGDKAAKAHGKFYTPASVAEAMARLVAPQDGESVLEPAAGTGGMLRAAAQAMRAQGRDPTTVTWTAVDVDELAIACLAVNVVLWGLGFKVLLGVGNALTDEWMHRARSERAETLAIAHETHRARQLHDLFTKLTRGTQPE